VPSPVALEVSGVDHIAQETYLIIDGLPPGTTIELDPIQTAFFCRGPAGTEPCIVEPGGVLGGERQVFDFVTVFEAIGTGDLDGYHRIIALDSSAETHTGPITPGDPVQVAPVDFFMMQGALAPGDPDFAQLQLVAGTGFGLPSPGSLAMTRLGPPGSGFVVDSFFDITYRIDFVGAPGGALDGLSGSTTGELRAVAADRGGAPAHNITIVKNAEPQGPTVFDYTGLAVFSLDDDLDATLPSRRTFNNLVPRGHTVAETPVAGWRLLRISCDDPDSGTTGNPDAGEVTIDLDLGEAITCTFVSVAEIDLIFADGFESGTTMAW
jgi:hypothetical protein